MIKPLTTPSSPQHLLFSPWLGGNTPNLENYLPKSNIDPENRPSEMETSIPTIHFQGRAVSFREGKVYIQNSSRHVKHNRVRREAPMNFQWWHRTSSSNRWVMNNKEIFAQHDLNISWKVSPDSCLVFVDPCDRPGLFCSIWAGVPWVAGFWFPGMKRPCSADLTLWRSLQWYDMCIYNIICIYIYTYSIQQIWW